MQPEQKRASKEEKADDDDDDDVVDTAPPTSSRTRVRLPHSDSEESKSELATLGKDGVELEMERTLDVAKRSWWLGHN